MADPGRPLLEVRGLVKRFGALVATNEVNLSVAERRAHAVIGPNGAGKTTLVAQISGFTAPSAGTIRFDGQDITRLPAHRRSLLGLARSFQITNLFLDLTVEDNVALAVQAHAGHSFRMLRPARAVEALRRPAREALERVGLAGRRNDPAGLLSHGEKRQLEIAMALATRPRLLLLDEPLAGMGVEEAKRMIGLLRELKREHAMILVEHDLEAVFAVADELSVLVYGSVIASGAPDRVRADPEVRKAYLGDGAGD